MESLNQLRLELVRELHSLPGALHSEFPDLAVDFLASVFQDCLDDTVPRLPKTRARPSTDPATTAAAGDSDSLNPPAPTQEQLAASTAIIDALQEEANRLEANAASRTAAPVDASEYNTLVTCQRCKKVMFSSVTEQHVQVCKEPPPRSIQIDPASNSTQATHNKTQGSDGSGGGGRKGANGGKRKRNGNNNNGKMYVEYSYDESNGTAAYDEAPLSPTLAAVAKLRQKRTEGGRRKRKHLNFVPDKELQGPIVLNGSPQQPRMMSLNNPQQPAAFPPSHLQQQQQFRQAASPVGAQFVVNNGTAAPPVPGRQQQQQPHVLYQGAVSVAGFPAQYVVPQQQQQQQAMMSPQLRSTTSTGGVPAIMMPPPLGAGQQQGMPPGVMQYMPSQANFHQYQQYMMFRQQQQQNGGRPVLNSPLLMQGGVGLPQQQQQQLPGLSPTVVAAAMPFPPGQWPPVPGAAPMMLRNGMVHGNMRYFAGIPPGGGSPALNPRP